MQSGQVNASQLLASFLGSENEKIAQAIAPQDFAGELKKLMPATANGGEPSARDAAAKPEKVEAADPRLKSFAGQIPAAVEAKSPTSPSIREQRGATDSRTKINAIKSKAQKEKSLFVTNPAIAATVLADLQYPAETRKACEGMQNKQGLISVKDLKSVLDTQPAIGSEVRAQVPAEHAHALVESIIAKGGGTNQKEFASGGPLLSSVQIKSEGSYTPDEFRGLLEKVLQQADTTQSQIAKPGLQHGSVETAKMAETAEGPKIGQTESLVETVLPSFISADHENGATRKIFAGNSNNQTFEAQSTKVRDVSENSIETVSDNLKSDQQLSAAKVISGGEDHEGVTLVTEAGIKGSATGSSTFSESALPSFRQETVSIPVKDLDPILKYFDARIVSAGSQQPEVNAVPTQAPGAPHEALAAQAQNLAPQVKASEKQADGPRGRLGSWRLQQDIAEQTEAARIKTVAGEFPSGERSFDSNPNRAAVLSQEIHTKAQAATTGDEKIQAHPGETSRSVEIDEKAASANQILGNSGEKAVPASEPLAGKLSDSIEGLEHRADSSTAVQSEDPVTGNEAQALATKPDSEEIPVEFREAPRGVENDGKAALANQILGNSGEKAVPASEPLAGKLSDSIEGLEHRAASSTAAQSEDPVTGNEAQVLATKPDSEEIPAELRETLRNVENDGKAALANQILGNSGEKAVPASEPLAGKLSDLLKAKAEAIVGNTDPDKIQAMLRETPQGVENDGKAASVVVRENPAEAGRTMVSLPESPAWSSRFGFTVEDFNPRADLSVFREGSDAGPSVHESSSAPTEMAGLTVGESNTALSGVDAAMLSKQIEKQFESRDGASESAVFQNSASRFQGVNEINLPQMDNSAQNGFAYQDPYRSAELAQNMREQLTGGATRQLVLEMEPDELGKISIKVEAKKDEISVVAVTQSEPARQVLMKHSPELRQDLQDQGLMLEKFMVDVNREKSGGGNYPEQNNPKGKTPPVPQTAKTGSIAAATGPAYIRKTDGQSRISIFA
ncbi:MAG: flagellar hook-length control protein FliK [Syntrophobacteraceae bacterium]